MEIGCCVLPLIQILIMKALATATGQFPVRTGEDAEQITEANKAELEQLGFTNGPKLSTKTLINFI